MSRRIILEMEPTEYQSLLAHLLPKSPRAEEAAFAYAVVKQDTAEEVTFRSAAIDLVPAEGFLHRSLYSFELTDETRARAIKRAHDFQASLVELHSHPFAMPAQFSFSDHAGFLEVVPHVRWRLKGRPYLAIVVGPDSFDGLVWADSTPEDPLPLTALRVGSKEIYPTGLSHSYRR